MQTEMRRVVVMGPAGAGKTSLCWRFGSPDAAFDPSSPRGGDGEPRTVRVDGVDVTMTLQNSYGDVLLNPSGHATKWTNTYLPNSNVRVCVSCFGTVCDGRFWWGGLVAGGPVCVRRVGRGVACHHGRVAAREREWRVFLVASQRARDGSLCRVVQIFDIKCFKVVVANKSDVAPAGSLAGGRALADECCCAFHAISVKDGTNVAAVRCGVVCMMCPCAAQ